MTATTRFLVARECRCTACHGTGRQRHPDWDRFFAAHPGAQADPEMGRLADGFFGPRHPSYNVPCESCGGDGWHRDEVPLQDALQALWGAR